MICNAVICNGFRIRSEVHRAAPGRGSEGCPANLNLPDNRAPYWCGKLENWGISQWKSGEGWRGRGEAGARRAQRPRASDCHPGESSRVMRTCRSSPRRKPGSRSLVALRWWPSRAWARRPGWALPAEATARLMSLKRHEPTSRPRHRTSPPRRRGPCLTASWIPASPLLCGFREGARPIKLATRAVG